MSTYQDEDRAKSGIMDSIHTLERVTEAKNSIICLSSELNFRYRVLPTYKHNRADVERPPLIPILKAFLIERTETMSMQWLEADDVMGVMSTGSPGEYVIATLDKDLQQIPGILFNWKKKTVRDVSQREADLYFYTQVLTGDPTDGYSGCPRVGPVKAAKILAEVIKEGEPYNEADVWFAIADAYGERGLTNDDALQQARVARILRTEDYNGSVKLWAPKDRVLH